MTVKVVMREIVPEIVRANPDGMLLVATKAVDAAARDARIDSGQIGAGAWA
jgi:hypothetical protein